MKVLLIVFFLQFLVPTELRKNARHRRCRQPIGGSSGVMNIGVVTETVTSGTKLPPSNDITFT